MKKNKFETYRDRVKDCAKKEPVKFAAIVLGGIVAIFWLISSFELLPEFPRLRLGRGMVIEQGDSLNWMGMQVVPVSRTIRKEFKIPGRIKGMLVLDEGTGVARKYGVKTGDVILSIGRKPVPNPQAFVNAANSVRYQEGILLDIYRDKKSSYLTIPFEYQYGPLWGPNRGGWQFGSPLVGQAMPYGPVVTDTTTTNAANR